MFFLNPRKMGVINANIKQVIPESVRDFLWMRKRDLIYLSYLARRFVRRSGGTGIPQTLRQEILTYRSDVEFSSIESLPTIFEELGFQFCEGRHTLYLYRESDIQRINPELISHYPHPFGLKIIKSQEMSPDGTPYYTSNKVARSSSLISMRAVGSVKEKTIISNILSLKNVAPKVYDIVKLQSDNMTVFAMVVQHIDGKILTGQAAVDFIVEFKRVLESEGILILGPRDAEDFQPPDFRRNIVCDPTGSYYVDIQNFVFRNARERSGKLADAIHEVIDLGESRCFRPEKYRDESVPGLLMQGGRDGLRTIFKIREFLDQNQVGFQDSTVLDVACNLGMFSAYALSRGARWCVGLERPEIVQVARQFLFEHGFTRFDMIGCDVKEASVAGLLPLRKYDWVIYASTDEYIGFPDWLNKLDMRFLLYKGHARETVKDIATNVKEWSPQIEIVDHLVLQDGDSNACPLLFCQIHPTVRFL